jgi:hypothetical protein
VRRLNVFASTPLEMCVCMCVYGGLLGVALNRTKTEYITIDDEIKVDSHKL